MSDTLPPLPEPYCHEFREPKERYTVDQMRSYAAECVAAERERCARLCENMHQEDGPHAYAWAIRTEWAADALEAAAVAEPVALETRADGKMVRVDRWEWGIRRIVAILWGNRHEFEIDDVVDAVRALAPERFADDESLVRAVETGYGAAPPQREREPLTDEQVDAMYSASYRTRESDYATNWYWYERGIREGERAHGITKEAP